jgi:hypothetical protein
MFTANPLTSATDEIVVNATWGLGEALVQGLVTPDEVVVQAPAKTTPLRIISAPPARRNCASSATPPPVVASSSSAFPPRSGSVTRSPTPKRSSWRPSG